tara:strand:- start:1309 stop:1512 length:204 start_codon:yes stop_codon:yes gene_type:complete
LCYFNGLSFLKRLPTAEEITDENQAIDLESGFKIKDSFIELRSEHKNDQAKCKADLQSLYEDSIDGR